MSEPQARSTLGTCWRTSRALLPSVLRKSVALATPASALLAIATLAIATISAPLSAQIRGGHAPSASAPSTWWLSGGAGASVITDVSDGATQSTWRFGSDPRWTARGSIEKALDDFTTLGVSASYGKIDVTIAPFLVTVPTPTTTTTVGSTPLPASCAAGCAAQTQLWTLMGQFRSGGGSGFHTLFEASGGVTGFRNMRTKDSISVAIGKPSGAIDLTGTLGAGFGYPITQGMVIALVQDFGIGFHAKADLPSGVGRTWRVRTTRASLRFRF